MSRIRRILGPLAACWIVCQLAGFALAPAVVWASTAEMLLECTCSHGDHAVCPMHHKPAPDAKRCLMRSAQDKSDIAVLGSLFGGLGLTPEVSTASVPTLIAPITLAEIVTKALGSDPPDPPPPRA
jgi:hypothetical protein